jgi:putative exosortase-associated protein (TIGR04073 family)
MLPTLRLGALFAAALLLAPLAQAEELGALRKLGRGFANLTLGVLEIPRNIVEDNRTNGPLSAATVGVALGLARAPARTVLGAYEILSAPFALPEAYRPMISPEYAWQLSEAAARAAHVAPADSFLGSEAQAIGRIPGAVVVRRGGALDENPDARVQVFGHADATGTEANNLTISAALAGNRRAGEAPPDATPARRARASITHRERIPHASPPAGLPHTHRAGGAACRAGARAVHGL